MTNCEVLPCNIQVAIRRAVEEAHPKHPVPGHSKQACCWATACPPWIALQSIQAVHRMASHLNEGDTPSPIQMRDGEVHACGFPERPLKGLVLFWARLSGLWSGPRHKWLAGAHFRLLQWSGLNATSDRLWQKMKLC